MKLSAWSFWAWQIRPVLKRARWKDQSVTWEESGWLRRTFSVRAPEKVIEEVRRKLRELEIPVSD